MKASEIKYSQLDKGFFNAEYYKTQYLMINNLLTEKKNVKSLDEIARSIVSGSYVSQYVDIGTLYLRVNNVKENEIDLSDVKFVDIERSQIPDKIRVKPNDILLTRTGTIGIACLVPQELAGAVISQHLTRITMKQDINPFYVTAFLNTKIGRSQTERGGAGSLQKELIHDIQRSIKIPIPPKSFQDHIGQIVKKSYERIRFADKKYEESQQLLYKKLGIDKPRLADEKTYKTTFSEIKKTQRFDAEFFHPKFTEVSNALVGNNKSKVVPLKELTKSIAYGTSEKLEYKKQGVIFIRVTDIDRFNSINMDEVKYISRYDAERLVGYKVNREDILISRTGTIGCAVYIDKRLEDSVFGSYFIKIEPKRDVNSLYVSIFLNSILGRLQSERLTSGAIQTNLTIPAIESIKIAVPSLDVQNEICEVYEQAIQLRNESKELIQKARHKVEEFVLSGS